MDERGIDLTRYSTIDAVDDLDAIRERLGYRQLDLGGWSYGSKFMLTYAHRHPERVRTISVFVPTIADYRRPLDWARFTEAALEGMFADCASEPACATAFPDLRGDFRRLVERLDREPVEATYRNSATGEQVSAVFDRARLIDELHFYLLKIPSLRRTPWLIHTAAAGNLDPLIDYAVRAASGGGARDEALYLSIVCPEEVARLTPEEARAAARGTFVGTHFTDEFQMACEVWNLPRHPDYPLAWRTLDVPALVVAGDRDPITPVEYGETIAAGFRRSRHLPIHRMPHHSSGMVGSSCLDEILLEFLATADPEALDTSCLRTISAHPFLTDSVPP